MTLPAPAGDLVEDYLRAVDAAAPGLVEGLYLSGSVAMGDFRRPGGLRGRAPSGPPADQ